jgi:ferredoxin-NADP reductase
VEGTAVLVSTAWRVADVVAAHAETATARTIRLRIPGLGGNLAGQHVDVRLTADDGYQAVRSYSVATAGHDEELEITVEELDDGEVSPYLVEGLQVGEQLEVRGPVGGWFIWRPVDPSPVQLIAGGSGVVPLMAMIRAHEASDNPSPFRLLYSLRAPENMIYRDELTDLAASSSKLDVDLVYTRQAPAGWPELPGRLDKDSLLGHVLPMTQDGSAPSSFYICGPTPFVEVVADWLVGAGYPPDTIKTERFGG